MPRDLHDHYFREAKREGYRSRAAYKLKEIDDRKKVLRRNANVLDAGAAPGSWLQVAWERVRPGGVVVGIDLQAITPFPPDAAIHLIEGDLAEVPDDVLLAPVRDRDSGKTRFDVILSDMAPATSGDQTIDHHQSVRLARLVIERAPGLLTGGGAVIIKVFEGEAYPELLGEMRTCFKQVKGFKPKASRSISREMYVIGTGFDPSAAAHLTGDTPPPPPRRPKPGPGWSNG
ncbi:MAG: RlmE family RNA methyltransferase [Phycisphaerales bacterium]|nr:RlmE family RNA methyltransferase [Phycisphaerales bacterium]